MRTQIEVPNCLALSRHTFIGSSFWSKILSVPLPKGTTWSQLMQMLMRIGGVIVGVVAGGTIGGTIGWALGDFGGRSDPENIWFLSLIVGASLGLAAGIAVMLRRTGRLGWGFSLVLGTISAIVCATVAVAFVTWQRQP